MGNKYKVKKRHTLSLMSIVIAIMVAISIMTTGYALWGSKLNISGNAIAQLDNLPELEVSIPQTGTNQYTTNTGFKSGQQWFMFVSDEYSGNLLVTTIRANESKKRTVVKV